MGTWTAEGKRQEGRTVSAKVRVSHINHNDSCQGSEGYRAWWRDANLDSDTFPRLCITHPEWWALLILAHSPPQPPWTWAFQAAGSAFLPERLLICTLRAVFNTRERFCLLAGPEDCQTHRLWNRNCTGEFPGKRTGLCDMPLTSSVYLALHVLFEHL